MQQVISFRIPERPLLFPAPLVLNEEEKRERDADLERTAERLVATLYGACSKKKKKR